MKIEREMKMSKKELQILNEIKKAFPDFTGMEAEAAVLLLKERANVLKMNFDEYIKKYHPAGFAVHDDSDVAARGYVQFSGRDAAAIIKAGKAADFSTFVHETTHIFRRQLEGNLKYKAEKAFAVQDGKWTVEQEEVFARGAEEFIRTRIEQNIDKHEVFSKCSEFVQNVYNGLGALIDLTPEMEEVYQEMFFGSDDQSANIEIDHGRKKTYLLGLADETFKQYTETIAASSDEEAFEKARNHINSLVNKSVYNFDEYFEETGVTRSLLNETEKHAYDEPLILYQSNIEQSLFDFDEIANQNNVKEKIPKQKKAKNDTSILEKIKERNSLPETEQLIYDLAHCSNYYSVVDRKSLLSDDIVYSIAGTEEGKSINVTKDEYGFYIVSVNSYHHQILHSTARERPNQR
ncbi:MAG: hypothetical protein Ta2F_18480 [Termitinemataceae bacterium]|nr:MAG: hypothetical protein Ta2F_18480 [Termitinemataceae bacterium]